MGHALIYLEYNVDGDMSSALMKRMDADSYDWALNNADLRECGGNPHLNPLRVIPSTFPNRAAAEDYLGRQPAYSHVAVRYRVHAPSKSVPELRQKLAELKVKTNEYIAANQVWNRTSEFIGCPSCGSRLSRVHLQKKQTSNCPLCGTSLLSTTVQSRIEGYYIRQNELVEKINAGLEGKDTGKTAWLVRCEVHC